MQKISQVILEFGKQIIPHGHARASEAEYVEAIKATIAAWNAVSIDALQGNTECEDALALCFDAMSRELVLDLKRLLKRKKKKFADDLRVVGEHDVRITKGDLILTCGVIREDDLVLWLARQNEVVKTPQN